MDVRELLHHNEHKDLLRLVTAGSVDDGKSTLIGRLLFESKGIFEDQLASVKKASGKKGSTQAELDLALVTDGLKAEREQGITIDVAYRYFSTPRRKFIIADTPGHEQYTRNMATGASTASLIIILIDASLGVLTQSRRHAFIAALLGIPHVVVAVNKMDLADYRQEVFEAIRQDFTDFAAKLELRDLTFIPVSALHGDNVVALSENMPWYKGSPLLNHLETVHIASDRNLIDLRFPVQYVSRPSSDFRGYMGTVASGVLRTGDELMVLPSGVRSRIKELRGPDGPRTELFCPQAGTVVLEDERDISRGDVLVHPNNLPQVDRAFEAMIVWMASEPLQPHRPYLIKHGTRNVTGEVTTLRYRVDVNTLHRHEAGDLKLNEIGRCAVQLNRPVCFDAYARNRATGAFIVVDRLTNNTVGAGMILDRRPDEFAPSPERWSVAPRGGDLKSHASLVTSAERRERLGQQPATVWLTGLTGAGKTTLAYALERRLFDAGRHCLVLDGENTRRGLGRDLGFSAEDRSENLRRAAEIARLLNDAGQIVLCAYLSPSQEDRRHVRQVVGAERFVEVYLTAPMDILQHRSADRYEQAQTGELKTFSGVTAPYEPPTDADLTLATHELDIDACVEKILALLRSKGLLG